MKLKLFIAAMSSTLALLTSAALVGFSLIELLVVVAIIGILAAIGTVGYNNYVNSARIAATVANAAAISSALQACDTAKNCANYIPTADPNDPYRSPLIALNIVAGMGWDQVNNRPLNPPDGISGSSNARNPWDNVPLWGMNQNIDAWGGGGGSGCTGLGHINVNVIGDTVQIQACTIDRGNYEFAADPQSPAPFTMINIHG
jgi:prepilin-type N-terminal cleavage/methylation domain-containing protein